MTKRIDQLDDTPGTANTPEPTDIIELERPSGANAGSYKTELSGFVREKLAANRTYYVRTDGSNSNDGLTNTAGGAFLTLQYASDFVAANIDLNSKGVTIQLGIAGSYVGVGLSAFFGNGSVSFHGDDTPANTANYIITEGTNPFGPACIQGYGAFSKTTAFVYVSGLKLAPVAGGCIYLEDGINLNITGHMIYACANGATAIVGSISDAGTSATIDASTGATNNISAFFYIQNTSNASFSSTPYTIVGTLTCTNAFLILGAEMIFFASFSGTVVGTKFKIIANGFAGRFTNLSAVPGDSPGVYITDAALTTDTTIRTMDTNGNPAFTKLSDLPTSPGASGVLYWNGNVLTKST